MFRRLLPLLFVLAAPAFGQTHSEQITVNVVEIPVHVERFGVCVPGLTKEHFELYVNGSRHSIDYFDVLDKRTVPSASPELRRRQLTVLLFDLRSSPFAIGQAAAAKVVAAAPPWQTFAVATIGRRGIQFVVPFTTDRIAVERAIATLTRSSARDPFSLATLDVERSAFHRFAGAGTELGSGSFADIWGRTALGGFTSSRAAATADDAHRAALRFEEAERESRHLMLTDHLGLLADRLAPLSGIKRVVLLSTEGGPGRDPAFLQAAMRMHARYRAAGVILDAVTSTWAPGPGGEMPNLLAADKLYTLALDTGGSVASSLAHLEQRRTVTYVLGFQPRGQQKKINRVRVRLLNQPWLTEARYRRTYSIGSENQDKTDALFLADALMNDIPQNGITVDVAIHGAEVAASIPGRELLARASNEPILLDVFLYVFNDRNLVAGWSHARISVDLDKGRDFLSANPYTVRKQFDLPPGRYTAKALIRLVGTDVTGFRHAAFDVSGL